MQSFDHLQAELLQGNDHAWLVLFHVFSYRVDAEGKPLFDTEWMPAWVEQLKMHAMNGNSFAMAFLGTLYLYGWGTLRGDLSKALDLIRRAAGLNNSYGEYMLGFLYLQGAGVAQNDERAVHWFKLAAQLNNPMANNMLGYMAENGLGGLRKNLAEALNYYRIAANQQLSFAMYNLGRLYEEGVGVSQDYAAAIRWYQQASDKGHDMAQMALATLYETGKGTLPDRQKAIRYLLLAAHSQYAPAEEKLVFLKKAGYEQQIGDVQQALGL